MYFAQFPKIWYDFPKDTSSTTLQVLTDITTNVRVRKQVLENITLYDEYDMMEGETPEIVAEKVYGNPEFHWVIMLVNQRYDYIADFPMTSTELYEHVISIYGADKIDNAHHYEKDGLIVDGKASIVLPVDVINRIVVNDFLTITDEINARVDYIDFASRTVNVTIIFGSFKTGQTISIRGFRVTETGVSIFKIVSEFVLGSNAVTYADGYAPITNYQHEMIENEKKRTIKLISPRLLDQFLREFNSLVTP